MNDANQAAPQGQPEQTTVAASATSTGKKPGAAVIVAIVSILGAAGVVGLTPTANGSSMSYSGPASADGAVRVRHDHALKLTFNPRTRTPGRRLARISFHFSYRFRGAVSDDIRKGVDARIERDWDRLRDSVLRVLTQQQPDQLRDMARLEVKLATAIDDAIFRDGIAAVDNIMFNENLVQ